MKIKRLTNLNWLLVLFVAICESTPSPYYHRHYSTGKLINSDHRERTAQLRKARSSSNQLNNLTSSPLTTSASSLHKVSFLPEDSFNPSKRHYTNQHYHQKQPKITGFKQNDSNIKRDLTEPIGFLNAVVNDHATSSTNQETDTAVRYPPNKAYKSSQSSLTATSTGEIQPFARRQRDFSESPLHNPTGSASDTNESMNTDEHESDSGSFSNNSGSSAGSGSHGVESPVESNEDFPSTGSNSPSSSSMDDESSPAVPYDNYAGSNSAVDDEQHARGNSLDEDEHSQNLASISSKPPTVPYVSSGPYSSSNFGGNPYLSFNPSMSGSLSSPFRGVFSSGPPISFPGYRPMTSPLSYPLISSASNSPLGASYKVMASENYPTGN